MKSKPFTYFFRVQYLGHRYHGWQKQPGVKTIQGMLERSFKVLLGHLDFNILGAGRTDSGVSCLGGAFELFSVSRLELNGLIKQINLILPDDIRILSAQEVDSSFNIIQDVKEKEYRYHFASGTKPHPFGSPFLVVMPKSLDIEMMKEGANIFTGEHDFRRFCLKPNSETQFRREVAHCEIVPNEEGDLWFHSGPRYELRVRGKGFLRNQVRIMMGALFEVGMGKLQLDDLKAALNSNEISPLSRKAPANGLVLQQVVF
ncbi:tRNA pseudouridine(38-40) synthase TruA [Echinicola jeungdonensis]|uniref:tRNA pseudouridine synthase A n=1 Tax=Echinicola jeungdonensis TaxID=709343 RepID=A0ABV5J0A1_9BACT|nr:tRNA pseudouridine(38-40) synthase TruA [Echinicola jeungdonensis]MDN3671140.1 tRNA pseudouridine(38-40) synthase TruA [Echinicola jeungdonensis]